MIKDVRDYEGQLADLNLAHDKHRSGTNPLEIMRFQKHVRERNDSKTKEVDAVFIQRQQREAATKDILDQIKALEEKTQQKIATLDEEKAARYAAQHENLTKLKERAGRGHAQIEQMKVQIHALEDEINNNAFRNEFDERTKKLARLKKETGNLEMDLDSLNMDPAEARQKLLAKVASTHKPVGYSHPFIHAINQSINQSINHVLTHEGTPLRANRFKHQPTCRLKTQIRRSGNSSSNVRYCFYISLQHPDPMPIYTRRQSCTHTSIIIALANQSSHDAHPIPPRWW